MSEIQDPVAVRHLELNRDAVVGRDSVPIWRGLGWEPIEEIEEREKRAAEDTAEAPAKAAKATKAAKDGG